MILIGLAIRLFGGGPALFKQERVGYLGRPFVLYKFRTMTVTSDPDIHRRHVEELIGASQPMVKMDQRGDARLLPLGRLLRATGLDELPQIINVLRGDMSLVGPRPCLAFEYERYLPWQRERFAVLPGLTGLWQVSGKNRTTFLEMIRLDIAYSRNMSPWFDLKIMLQTLPALLAQMRETRAQGRPQSAARLSSGTRSPAKTLSTS
jgi:lipopolysaccharide/colanic/teichoic acid biosynthesis glycosyltransferase